MLLSTMVCITSQETKPVTNKTKSGTNKRGFESVWLSEENR